MKLPIAALCASAAIMFMATNILAGSNPAGMPVYKPASDAYTYYDNAPGGYVQDQAAGSYLLQSNNYAADILHENLRYRLEGDSPILTAVFTELGSIEKSSSFGRLAAEQISARLAQYGYLMVEARMRKSIAFREEQGEFLLSRDINKLGIANFQVKAAMVGNYQRSGNQIFVSTRVIRLGDQVVLASCEYSLPAMALRGLLRENTDVSITNWGRNPAFAGGPRLEASFSQPTGQPSASPQRPPRAKTSDDKIKSSAAKSPASTVNSRQAKNAQAPARKAQPRQEDRPANLPVFAGTGEEPNTFK